MQFLSWWPKGSKVVCVFNSHILKIKPRYSTRLLHIYWKVTLWFSSIFPEKLSRERVTLWAFFRVLWASVDVGWDPRGPSTAGGHRQSTPWIRVIDHWDQQRGTVMKADSKRSEVGMSVLLGREGDYMSWLYIWLLWGSEHDFWTPSALPPLNP